MSTPTRSPAPDRRARGLALVAGAGVLLALVGTGALARSWFLLLVGLTYLAAAAAGRSRAGLWAPGCVVTCVGLAAGLWLADGRSVDRYDFVAVVALALGLGGVLAALLGRATGVEVTAMGVSLSVLLFGAFVLAEQQGVAPFAGHVWPYAALLALWGAYELGVGAVRPGRAAR